MAEEVRPVFKPMTTPKGKVAYAWLTSPDTKFYAEGVYHCQLWLSAGQPEVDAFIGELEACTQKVFEYEKAKRTPIQERKKALSIDSPFSEGCDADGNETGELVIKAKQKAAIEYKDKKTGEKKKLDNLRPMFFDAQGKAIEKPPAIYPGSIVRLRVQPVPYMRAVDATCGVSLRLVAVQIVELAPSTFKGATAEECGFESEEGYIQESIDTASFPQSADDF